MFHICMATRMICAAIKSHATAGYALYTTDALLYAVRCHGRHPLNTHILLQLIMMVSIQHIPNASENASSKLFCYICIYLYIYICCSIRIMWVIFGWYKTLFRGITLHLSPIRVMYNICEWQIVKMTLGTTIHYIDNTYHFQETSHFNRYLQHCINYKVEILTILWCQWYLFSCLRQNCDATNIISIPWFVFIRGIFANRSNFIDLKNARTKHGHCRIKWH